MIDAPLKERRRASVSPVCVLVIPVQCLVLEFLVWIFETRGNMLGKVSESRYKAT